MHKLVALALAGALGTLARHVLASGVMRVAPGEFPWGTLAVNLLGCFLFGAVVTLSRERGWITPQSAQIVLIGFMGAFTTFSSFVNDTIALGTERPGAALTNVVVQNVGGLVCYWAGSALARLGA